MPVRTQPAPDNYTDAGNHPGVQTVDWKDNPAETLEAIDLLLKPLGLEVVLLDVGDDAYHFKIEKASA